MPPRRKRGRPPNYVIGRDGRLIVGLSFNPSSQQYYASHSKPRVYFGSDIDQAVARFRTWQAVHRDQPLVAVQVNMPSRLKFPKELDASNYLEQLNAGRSPEELSATRGGTFHLLPSDALHAWARAEIVKNPVHFAQRVGIPEIGYLQDLKPPEPSLTLKQVGAFYANKKRRLTDAWRRKQSMFWDEFCTVIGVGTLREINADAIRGYHDHIWQAAEKGKLSPTYILHREQAVRTILRYALKQGKDVPQVRRLLDLCAVFEQPKKKGTDPRPIRRDDFQRLLSVCSPKWRAALLLSLNAAFYPSELSSVRKDNIDLHGKTLVMDRGKTGVPRIAVLWPRTVEAIQVYQNTEPHNSDHVFVNALGAPYDGNHVGRNFRRLRKKAGLPDEVTFDMLRDGSVTAAIDGGADVSQAKLLAGHRVGISDHYLKRNPRMVAQACTAIERTYF